MSLDFPNVRFGKCEVCGADGGDYAAASLSSADASGNIDVSGNGVELESYDGKLVCNICKSRLTADEESLQDRAKQDQEERFRQQAGFTRKIS